LLQLIAIQDLLTQKSWLVSNSATVHYVAFYGLLYKQFRQRCSQQTYHHLSVCNQSYLCASWDKYISKQINS